MEISHQLCVKENGPLRHSPSIFTDICPKFYARNLGQKIKHKRRIEMTKENTRTEEFEFNGDKLITQIKELINKGNIRRIIINSEEGRVLIDIPLTVGILGTLVAPQLAALGAIAALVTRGTIIVEKVEEESL